MDRRRLVIGYSLTAVGLLLAVVVANSIPGVPQPPACSTANCNAASIADLVGLFAIIAGMITLAFALFQGSSGKPVSAQAIPSMDYSFTPSVPGAGTPLARPSAPPALGGSSRPTYCPSCGAPITSDYGFCPRCGRTLGK